MAMITLHTSAATAAQEMAECPQGQAAKLIKALFRKPTRYAAVLLHTDLFVQVNEYCPEQYRVIVTAALEGAAERLLRRELASYSQWPSSLDGGLFCDQAILGEAEMAGFVWLSKDELETAWRASATRSLLVNREAYKTSKAYRMAYAALEGDILKLAAKQAAIKREDLEFILAKLLPEDIDTEFGVFVTRRVDMLLNKQQRAVDEVDKSML